MYAGSPTDYGTGEGFNMEQLLLRLPGPSGILPNSDEAGSGMEISSPPTIFWNSSVGFNVDNASLASNKGETNHADDDPPEASGSGSNGPPDDHKHGNGGGDGSGPPDGPGGSQPGRRSCRRRWRYRPYARNANVSPHFTLILMCSYCQSSTVRVELACPISGK